LKHLARFPNLKVVGLQYTPVTDKGLENLKTLQNLTDLNLQDTKVTTAGVAALQAALPNCKVVWQPPADKPAK
jgi:Ran GTPase-activating protein (RanGAP) involved in mRNA processing and transport